MSTPTLGRRTSQPYISSPPKSVAEQPRMILGLFPGDQAILQQFLEVRGVLIVLFANVFLQARAGPQHDFAGDGVWLSKRLGIFHQRFVINGVVVGPGEALDDMQRLRM